MQRFVLQPLFLTAISVFCLSPQIGIAGPNTEEGGGHEHLIFLGLDLEVQDAQVQGRITDFSRGEVLVSTISSSVPIKAKQVKDFKTVIGPKVAKNIVSIDEVNVERTYTPGNSPHARGFAHQTRTIEFQESRQELAASHMRYFLNRGGQMPTEPGIADEPVDDLGRPPPTVEDYIQAVDDMESFEPGQFAEMNSGFGEGAYDALEFSMEVSSPEEITDGYAIVLATVLIPEAPTTPYRVVIFDELPIINHEPKRVRITHSGLPWGFTIDEYQIHIYSQGLEIATNLSANSTAVSRSEAHDFLIMQRLVANRRSDLPAAIVRPLLDREDFKRIPSSEYGRFATVRVDHLGGVIDVRLSPEGDSAVDMEIMEAIRETAFYPALVNGVPAEGIATIELSQLTL